MKIDLHIHSNSSDGRFTLPQIFAEANHRNIKLLSITDHDSIKSQSEAIELAKFYGINYITGVELTSYYSIPEYNNDKPTQLHLLAYGFNHKDEKLGELLSATVEKRKTRAKVIFNNMNSMLKDEGKVPFDDSEFNTVYINVPFSVSRSHIADFLIDKRIVRNRKEAFQKYLVKCNVTLESQTPQELAEYIHNAGGKLFIAHPADPGETSLTRFSKDILEQFKIIQEHFLEFIDGLECYHCRHDSKTIQKYIQFCRTHNLLISGGSDCHQHPKIQMGSICMPDFIAEQFADFIIT